MGLSVFVVLSISITLCSAGSLFLAGGEVDDNNTEIYGGMVTAAGGHNAVVAVITAASADGCCGPDSSWALYEPIFLSYGPRNVIWIPIDVNHTENNHNPAVLKNLTESSLFFFSGGDQVCFLSFLCYSVVSFLSFLKHSRNQYSHRIKHIIPCQCLRHRAPFFEFSKVMIHCMNYQISFCPRLASLHRLWTKGPSIRPRWPPFAANSLAARVWLWRGPRPALPANLLAS